MRFPLNCLALACTLSAALTTSRAQPISVQDPSADAARAIAHSTPEWKLIEPHLPSVASASALELETQADLLRVRRFPEDALDFYAYALKKGGSPEALLNKIGVTELEIGNKSIARAYFQQAVRAKRADPQAWNNLGAVQFLDRDFTDAIRSYKRALKLDKRSAVSHSNLGIAYIEIKDFSSAKSELSAALKLDPEIFQRASSTGAALHMITTGDRANFCFQMAKVYARLHNEPEMLHSLETAAEAGFNVQYEMSKDYDLAKYEKDPRVVSLVFVAKSLRDSRAAHSSIATALPPAKTPAAR